MDLSTSLYPSLFFVAATRHPADSLALAVAPPLEPVWNRRAARVF